MSEWPLKHNGPCACRFIRREEFGVAEQVEWCGFHSAQRDILVRMRATMTSMADRAKDNPKGIKAETLTMFAEELAMSFHMLDHLEARSAASRN